MLDPELANNPSQDKRRAAVRRELLAWLKTGTFNYTEVLCAMEPLKSDILEVLDGVVVTASMAGSGGQLLEQGLLKLVHVNPSGTLDDNGRAADVIKHPLMTEEEVPGTDRMKKAKAMHSFGNYADVPDMVPDRIGRMILVRDGWPIRQSREGSSVIGTVVEWRWLKQRVDSGKASSLERKMHDEMLTRPGFRAFVGEAETENKQPNKSNRGGAPAPAGV